MEVGPQAGQSWLPNTFTSHPKLRTHNLVCRPMYVSDWPKRPNMVPKPNLGGNSTFLYHSLLSRGVLPFAPIAATPLGIGMKFNSDMLLGHN